MICRISLGARQCLEIDLLQVILEPWPSMSSALACVEGFLNLAPDAGKLQSVSPHEAIGNDLEHYTGSATWGSALGLGWVSDSGAVSRFGCGFAVGSGMFHDSMVSITIGSNGCDRRLAGGHRIFVGT